MNILKIGGGEGVNHIAILQNLAERVRNGEQWIVVHGVSAEANRLAEERGVPVQTITSPGGHVSRYTNAEMIDVYEDAVQNVNNIIINQLTDLGVDGHGFGQPLVIRAQRKAAIRAIRNGRQMVIRNDYSGRITEVDRDALMDVLEAGYVPVIAPIALGEEGESLNVDGDLVAAEIASALDADTLIILSNVPGLLRDVDEPGSVVSQFALNDMGQFESYAQGRMKKKLIAAETAQARRTILAGSHNEYPLDAALAGGGTHIIGEMQHA
jgi:acetylglutamate/LysW-gamma-L-alpha-aminoadipate kinase